MGLSCFETNDKTKARGYIKKSIIKRVIDEKIYYCHAYFDFEDEKYEQCLGNIMASIKIKSGYKAFWLRAKVCAKLNNIQKAIED